MPILDAELSDFVVGDDFNVEWPITNIPVGAVLAKAWLTVKKSENQADANALFQISITSTYVAGSGYIQDTGVGDTQGYVFFEVRRTNSVKLTGDKTHYFDIQVLTDTDKLYTPVKGTMTPRKQITQATS